MTESKRHFSIDARTVLQLGRQSIKDHTTALIELVKNAYDADAKIVEIDITEDQIRIADNGSGMTQSDFEKKWLRIGFSSKRRGKRSPSGERRVVGEKGVGRISADRLGADLELRTKAHASGSFSARVNWDDFDVENTDLASIAITLKTGVKPKLPSNTDAAASPRSRQAATGTELLIRQLRQSWSKDDIDELVEELSTLVAPFQEETAFEIVVQTDIPDAFSGVVPPFVTEHAPLELQATLNGSKIKYSIIDRTGDGTPHVTNGELTWAEIGPPVKSRGNGKHHGSNAPKMGPVSLTLYYLPSKAFSKRPKGLSLSAARKRALGVRIYRDAIRVRPYGDMNVPEGDWLKLAARKSQDPAGVSRKTYRIPPTELAGAVLISRDQNRNLQDSAAREGLINNDAYHDLRALTLGCVRELESYRHTIYVSPRNPTAPPPALYAVEQFSLRLRNASREWRSIRSDIAKNPLEAAARASEVIQSISEGIRQTRASLDAVVEQMRLYRGLSTLGISASVFGHETQNSIALCLGNLRESIDELHDASPNVALLRKTVPLAYEAGQRVSAWGAFAVSRVRHEKRRAGSFEVTTLIERLVRELGPAYNATKTTIVLDLETVTIRAYQMDFEAILLNLLTNAYSFAQEASGKRAVRITTRAKYVEDKPGMILSIADSGPGVPENRREIIWEPLYTTRRDAKGNEVGTGLGLAIIDSILREVGGTRTVDTDPQLGGAHFSVWTPLKWT